MKILVERDYESLSRRAAELIAIQIGNRRDIVLGLATGSTPLGVYRHWVQQVQYGELSFAEVSTFNLDEYRGLARTHPQSYFHFMQEHLFSRVNLKRGRTHIPQGDVLDVEAHCREYEAMITGAGGIDIQLLGIGRNGHIGFNEPGSDFGRLTHEVALSESTRQANARFFATREKVPTHAITMGLKSIMNARQIVLLASGPHKKEAVRLAVSGPVTPDVPASVLQLHPNCLFLLDEAAASGLPASLARDEKELSR